MEYIAIEGALRSANPWMRVKLLLKAHEAAVATDGVSGARVWVTRNRLYEAISAYKKGTSDAK